MFPTLLRHVYHDQPRMLPPPFLFPNIISFFELPPQPWIIIVVIRHPHTWYSHHFFISWPHRLIPPRPSRSSIVFQAGTCVLYSILPFGSLSSALSYCDFVQETNIVLYVSFTLPSRILVLDRRAGNYLCPPSPQGGTFSSSKLEPSELQKNCCWRHKITNTNSRGEVLSMGME